MTPQDFDSFVQALSGALKLHDWRIVAGLGCIALVWGFRKAAAYLPKRAADFFASDRGGALSALVIGIAGSFGRALFATKDPITAQFVVDGVVMGVTAAGGFSVVKKLLTGVDPAKAGTAALAALLMFSPGCAWLRAHVKISGALECGLKEIASALPSVLADVASALSGGSPDWAALGKLEISHGPDLIACAAQKLMSPPPGAAVNPRLIANARAYLDAKGVK